MKVALLGTGLMGFPMSERILKNGHKLTVYNRTRRKAEPLAQSGARIAASPAQTIQEADFVILMLTDASAVRDVLFSDTSGLELANRTVVQMSTITPDESLDLKQKVESLGGEYLEAPVLGSTPQAKEGRLIVMVGSSAEQFQRCSDLLKCFTAEPLHIGDVGQAAALKLAFNQLIAAGLAAFSYSLGVVLRRGINADLFMKILKDSPLFALQFELKLPRILERDFTEPHFPTKHLKKDVQLALSEGRALGLETAGVEGVLRIIEKALEMGWEDTDYSSLYNAVNPEKK